jgi:hypothetical protein
MGVRRGKARDSGSVGRGRHVEDWYKSAFIMMIGQRFFVKEFIGVWIADWNVGTPQTIESLLERRNKPHPDTKIACITEGDRETNDLTDKPKEMQTYNRTPPTIPLTSMTIATIIITPTII